MAKSAKLGQNFLRDEGFARRIVDLVPPGSGPILEIGAGRGILSALLVERFPGRRLVLVEIDPRLAAGLEGSLGGKAEIMSGDILETDLAALFPGEKATVVGNLPYHISKPLVDWFVYRQNKIDAAVVMLQKDFVDKLLATPGGKKYNAQSVAFQLLFDVRRAFDVPAGAFVPRPKVVSTVIAAEPAKPPMEDVEKFYGFVRQCFSERRKTLWNNLTHRFPEAVLAASFSAAGVPARARAEQQAVERFVALWQTVDPCGNAGIR